MRLIWMIWMMPDRWWPLAVASAGFGVTVAVASLFGPLVLAVALPAGLLVFSGLARSSWRL